MAKYKRKVFFVEAIQLTQRISLENGQHGEPGDWFVQFEGEQKIMSDEEFRSEFELHIQTSGFAQSGGLIIGDSWKDQYKWAEPYTLETQFVDGSDNLSRNTNEIKLTSVSEAKSDAVHKD